MKCFLALNWCGTLVAGLLVYDWDRLGSSKDDAKELVHVTVA